MDVRRTHLRRMDRALPHSSSIPSKFFCPIIFLPKMICSHGRQLVPQSTEHLQHGHQPHTGSPLHCIAGQRNERRRFRRLDSGLKFPAENVQFPYPGFRGVRPRRARSWSVRRQFLTFRGVWPGHEPPNLFWCNAVVASSFGRENWAEKFPGRKMNRR